jgi:hypothetical protein
MHETCGEHVKVGDLLQLLPTVVTIKDKPQEAIKLVRNGFAMSATYITNFMQVKELYCDSTNRFKRHKDYCNMR